MRPSSPLSCRGPVGLFPASQPHLNCWLDLFCKSNGPQSGVPVIRAALHLGCRHVVASACLLAGLIASAFPPRSLRASICSTSLCAWPRRYTRDQSSLSRQTCAMRSDENTFRDVQAECIAYGCSTSPSKSEGIPPKLVRMDGPSTLTTPCIGQRSISNAVCAARGGI